MPSTVQSMKDLEFPYNTRTVESETSRAFMSANNFSIRASNILPGLQGLIVQDISSDSHWFVQQTCSGNRER